MQNTPGAGQCGEVPRFLWKCKVFKSNRSCIHQERVTHTTLMDTSEFPLCILCSAQETFEVPPEEQAVPRLARLAQTR